MSEQLLSEILKQLSALLSVVVLGVGGLALEYVRRWLKSKVDIQTYQLIEKMASSAVVAAEQVGGLGKWSGVQKKHFAIRALQGVAVKLNVKVSEQLASDLIESFVASSSAYHARCVTTPKGE